MFIALKLRQWFTGPVESVFLQVPRALAAAVLALLLDIAILESCVHVFGMSAVLGAMLGYLAGCMVQYVLCSVWVFPMAQQSGAAGFLAFLVLALVGLGLTWFAIVIVHDWAGMNIEIAKAVAVVLAFAWNFASRKYFLFRKTS